MPRKCSICSHPRKDEINHALIGSESHASIAERFRVVPSSLSRHYTGHLRPRLTTALARSEQQVDESRLVSWVLGVHELTLAAALKAREAKDAASERAFLREARENLKLIAELADVLNDKSPVTIDLRRQVAVLAQMSEEDLVALAGHARELSQPLLALPAGASVGDGAIVDGSAVAHVPAKPHG